MAAESLSPAEPRGRRVRAQARFEAEILVRNGEQILVALVLPVLALLALVASPYPELPEPRIALVAPGVLALAVVSTACLLYTSPSPRDRTRSRMPSSA